MKSATIRFVAQLNPSNLVTIRQGKHHRLDVEHVLFIGGDEWMLVAERLGLTQAQIRFLERRSRNPFEDALVYSRSQRYLNVGQLYDTLVNCEFPTFADLL